MTDKVNIMTDAGADIAQVSLAVANRIRNWRKEKKLSLDELSRRASVSKGMLVEIEKGAANPSIAILCKLAAALGISFITEGAIPFAAKDPLRVIPSIMIGSAITGAISMAVGAQLHVPHGGIFVLPMPNAVSGLLGYAIAIAVGTVITAVALFLLKKPLKDATV